MTRTLVPPHPRRGLLVLVVGMAWVLVLGSCTGDDGTALDDSTQELAPSDPETTVAGPRPPGEVVGPLGRLLVTREGGRPAIVDEQDREVLLRGANLNSLGDYPQVNLFLPPTKPPTEEDWDQMAAHGFSVVRLVLSWSALEPVRGQLDLGYIERIQAAVAAAADRGMYTVLDMHQDAWSRFVASPPDVGCPPGTEPAIGGDGAPLWATLTDGADTCHPPGNPDGAPAVRAAFTAFYENREGIRDAFATTWKALVAVFATEPAVVGYDLLNEPTTVADPLISARQYTDLVVSVLGQIRAGEAEAGGFAHIVFLEPMVPFPLPGTLPVEGEVVDDQIVFAPHDEVEAGSGGLPVEQILDIASDIAQARGWPLWIGEHGVHATDEAALDVARRFATAQDAHRAGGAWWQWRQWCGDPQSIGVPGRTPTEARVQLNTVTCPDDVDAGPTTELLATAGRAYPRAAPGRIIDLTSDPDARTLSLEGRVVDDLATGRDLVLWVPGDAPPEVSGDGVSEPTLTPVPGGWYASLAVDDSPYRVEVE